MGVWCGAWSDMSDKSDLSDIIGAPPTRARRWHLTSPPVLKSALSVHECLVRRLVGHVRQVRPVRHYWCAAHASKALAVDKFVFAIEVFFFPILCTGLTKSS